MDVNIMTVSGNVYQTTISGCLIHIQTWTSSWTVSAKFYWLHQLDVSFRSMVWPHQANYQVNLHAWHTTDKSWPILSANSVRREKSFVCHRKIGQIFSADKSWPTKKFSNLFENTTTYQRKSHAVIGQCLLFEISRPWNDAVTIKLIEVYEVNW